MFRCEHCFTLTSPRQPVNRIVRERRTATYTKEVKNSYRKPWEPKEYEDVQGWEIVKEISCCPKCYQTLTGKEPRLVESVPVAPQKQEQRPRRDNKFRNNKFDNNKKKPFQKPERKQPTVEVINPLQVIK